MKDCRTCGEAKPKDQFYPNRAKCKRCYCDQTLEFYQKNKESYRKVRAAYMREFRKDPVNHMKSLARMKVYWAIQGGRLTKERCFCGGEAEAHHEDYSKPLSVKWLCKQHHTEVHRG